MQPIETVKIQFFKIATLATIFLAIFLIAAALNQFDSLHYAGRENQPVNSIAVDGTGDVYAIPDTATFGFSVDETAKTVTDAQTTATTKVNAAIAVLKNAGVADADIQTTGYNISPHYEYQQTICPTPLNTANGTICQQGNQVLTGYDVSQSVQVKVRDLTKAGTLFQQIGALNVQNVNNLQFSVDSIDTVKDQARAKAIANAEARAQTIAGQLGVKLVRVMSFSDSTNNSTPYPLMMAAASVSGGAAAPVPQVPQGQQEVTSNVTVTYEIR